MYGFGLCRSCIEDERAMRGNDGELGGRGVLGTCTEGKERAELEVVGGLIQGQAFAPQGKTHLETELRAGYSGSTQNPIKTSASRLFL